MTELKYKDITEKIIGAAFEVHKFLVQDLSSPIGKWRVDFIVEGKVLFRVN